MYSCITYTQSNYSQSSCLVPEDDFFNQPERPQVQREHVTTAGADVEVSS